MPAGKFSRATGPVKTGTKKDQAQDKQIMNLGRRIKKIEFDNEVKYYDFAVQDQDMLEVGWLNNALCYGVLQGDAFNQREGNEIITTSLLIRGTILTDGLALAPSFVRMIVFWDKQTNNGAPTISGAANSLMSGSPTVGGHLDWRNQDTISRFDIISDKTYTLNPQVIKTLTASDVTANQPVSVAFSKRVRLGRKIKYLSSTGSAGDLVSNNIAVAFIGDSDTNPAQLDCNFRLYFKD